MRLLAAIMFLATLTTAALAAPAPEAAASPAPASAAAPGQCYAVLVGAMPGEALYATHYRDWLKRLRAHLVQAGVPAGNIVILSGDKEFADPAVAGVATVESIKRALADMAAKVQPQDQFILALVGHGVSTEKPPTLVLPGPDVTAQDLADALAAIPAANQVVLNLSSSAGSAVEMLVRRGRVIVAANSPAEGNEPIFPEFFLRGLESKRADGEGAPAAGAKDGRITLLEAVNWATHEAALWTLRLKKTETGWKLDGKESVEIFEKLFAAPPGAPGTQKLAADSDRARPDGPVVLKPADGKIDESWISRRVLSEHAVLEDCGEKAGASALRDAGYEPLAGRKPGQPGHLARRVVLGQADLLPESPEAPAAKP